MTIMFDELFCGCSLMGCCCCCCAWCVLGLVVTFEEIFFDGSLNLTGCFSTTEEDDLTYELLDDDDLFESLLDFECLTFVVFSVDFRLMPSDELDDDDDELDVVVDVDDLVLIGGFSSFSSVLERSAIRFSINRSNSFRLRDCLTNAAGLT